MTSRPERSIRPLEEAMEERCPVCNGMGTLPEFVATNEFWRGLEMSGREEICWACKGTAKLAQETGE